MRAVFEKVRLSLLTAILLFCLEASPRGAVFHVSSIGSDSNPGTSELPWKTIQKAADVAQEGDRIVIAGGSYDERVVSKRGGTSDVNRITFETSGDVVMRGWTLNHSFITVRGFQVTGHSAATVLDGHVNINNNADHTVFENNIVRDGIYILKTNIAFHSNWTELDTITSDTGGFLSARFKPGQFLYIGRGERISSPTNTGVYQIQAVTDTTVTVLGALKDEPPSNVYLSGSFSYGLVIGAGAEECVIRSNTFRNLSYDTWFVGGVSNLFEGNILEACHGWDAMHFMGSDHIFRGNVIRNSPLVIYQISPDVFENFSTVKYERVLFERNFVQGFDGVLASHKGSTGAGGDLTYSRNVFVNVGSFYIRYPRTKFINNTFVNVSAESNPVTQALRHPITFDPLHTENAVLKNNIFVGCGAGRTPDQQGWYELAGASAAAVVQNNFVCGPSPLFAPKAGFAEGIPALNGGDPGFINIADPLGADGLPFTDDDGLRLKADSKLRRAGENGGDLGAYEDGPAKPELKVLSSSGGAMTISWQASDQMLTLQRTDNLSAVWRNVEQTPVTNGNLLSHTILVTNAAEFFRLVQ